MLSTLLLLLKISTIAILILAALLVFVLLLVLGTPIRYKASGAYHKELKAEGRITWLLHYLSLRCTYDKDLNISFRILGFSLFQTDSRETEELKEKMDIMADQVWYDNQKEDESDREVSEGYQREETSLPEWEEEKPAKEKRENTIKKKKKSSPQKKFSLEKAWKQIQCRVQSLFQKMEEGKAFYERVRGFIENPANQKMFRRAWRMVRHILPRKILGDITFGFEDPATTGKALALLGLAWSWYGDNLKVTPVFDENVLEGELRLQGRVIPGVLLFWGILILMNQEIRRLLLRRGRKMDGGKENGGK